LSSAEKDLNGSVQRGAAPGGSAGAPLFVTTLFKSSVLPVLLNGIAG